MKALRRSLNKDNSQPPSRVPHSISRPATTVAPPQKVIRALSNYRSTTPQELSFTKGDFFYVAHEVDEGSGWYEAHNPSTNARGLVPREYFEEFKKGGGGTRSSIVAGPQNSPSTSYNPGTPASPPASSYAKHPGALYAVVQYDFVAERPDELDAKAGESILVIAQSNREWFVAKPIGRLGSAGLIPVSFVEVRDPATDKRVENVEELIDRGEVPRVDEWKQQAAMYKAATIPLGKIDLPPNSAGVVNSPFAPPGNQYPFPITQAFASSSKTTLPEVPEQYEDPTPLQPLPPGLPAAPEISSFHVEHGAYWFQCRVLWLPDLLPPATRHPPSIHLQLYRRYEDFYEFQIALLDAFPVEAGRVPPSGSDRLSERILPFMPGPLTEVNDLVSATRQMELEIYLKQLCDLPAEHVHVMRSDIAKAFFSLRTGDLMTQDEPDDETDVDGTTLVTSHLSGQDFSIAGEAARSSLVRTSSGKSSGNSGPTRNASPQQDLRSGTGLGHGRPPPNTANAPGGYIPQYPPAPLWSASRVAASPMISETCQKPAYLRIKVFNARTDDLIAIRVHPRVTYDELMEKIRERVGPADLIRYRGQAFVPGSGELGTLIETDEELVQWIVSGERLILYAE